MRTLPTPIGSSALMSVAVSEVDKIIGSRARELREMLGITIVEVARHVGCSEVQMSDLERAKRRWHSSRQAAVAEFLGVSPGLLGDPDVPIEKLAIISGIIKKLSAHPEDRIEAFAKLLDTMPS